MHNPLKQKLQQQVAPQGEYFIQVVRRLLRIFARTRALSFPKFQPAACTLMPRRRSLPQGLAAYQSLEPLHSLFLSSGTPKEESLPCTEARLSAMPLLCLDSSCQVWSQSDAKTACFEKQVAKHRDACPAESGPRSASQC